MRRIVFGLVVIVVALPALAWWRLQVRVAALSHALVNDALALEAASVSAPGPDFEQGNVLECLAAQPARLDKVQVEATLACARFDWSVPLDFEERANRTLASLTASIIPADYEEPITLASCGRAFVLAAAVLRMGGLDSMLKVLELSRSLVEKCGLVLVEADTEKLGPFLGWMEHARAFLPRFSQVMEVERVETALRVFGSRMSTEEFARLSARGKGLVRASIDRPTSLAERVAWRITTWPRYDTAMRRLASPAVDVDEPARSVFIRDAMRGLEPVLGSSPVDPKYDLYAAELDDLRVMNDLLVEAARVRRGEAPRDVPGLSHIVDDDGLVHLVPVSPSLTRRALTVRPAK